MHGNTRRAFGFRRSNSTSGHAVQANLTSKIFTKENDSALLNFLDYEQKPNRKMKWLLLVFCEIVAWFSADFLRRIAYLLCSEIFSGVPSKLIALFMREWKMKWWLSKRWINIPSAVAGQYSGDRNHCRSKIKCEQGCHPYNLLWTRIIVYGRFK